MKGFSIVLSTKVNKETQYDKGSNSPLRNIQRFEETSFFNLSFQKSICIHNSEENHKNFLSDSKLCHPWILDKCQNN